MRTPGCGSQQHEAWSGSFEEPAVENRENSGGRFDVGIQLDQWAGDLPAVQSLQEGGVSAGDGVTTGVLLCGWCLNLGL